MDVYAFSEKAFDVVEIERRVLVLVSGSNLKQGFKKMLLFTC